MRSRFLSSSVSEPFCCAAIRFGWKKGTMSRKELKLLCWPATILQSSNVAWEYGISGPFCALTGVNIYAASFLIPFGVVVYTLAGGLKATFLASYIHSVIGKVAISSKSPPATTEEATRLLWRVAVVQLKWL
ncbi:hypothetical protein K7X08_020882 [Anisodus acutangulus]|uniref:Uncharacterized protein n=1 Tax=Anisodus acutangulus TaxID=402998 RepID=A0A9Q1MTB5_9SOLA|nr:hypothetical protein K7X08_020882 [Anisodus acutangulus]